MIPGIIGLILIVLILFGLLRMSGWFRKERSVEKMVGVRNMPEYALEHIRFSSTIPETGENEHSGPEFLWLGHGTMFISWGNRHLIVDPISRESIFIVKRWIERWHPDGLIHHLDGILLTHGHMDHLCNETLMLLPPTDLIIPDKTGRFLKSEVKERHNPIRVSLEDTVNIHGMEIIPVEALHGGWRYPWQLGYFAVGYIIRYKGKSLYVAGDSAWGSHFAKIGEKYAPDFAILPIGAYSPRVYLKQKHMNPEEAIKAYHALGCRKMLPMHFGTYRLSLERMKQPLDKFVRLAQRESVQWELNVWKPD